MGILQVQTKAQRLMGVDTLLTNEKNSILTAVNKYARLAWDRAPSSIVFLDDLEN